MNLENAKFTVKQVAWLIGGTLTGAFAVWGFISNQNQMAAQSQAAITTITQAIRTESDERQKETQKERAERQKENEILRMQLEKAIEYESKTKKEDIERLVKSVDGVKEQIERITVFFIQVRQAEQWIQMFRELNKDKFPEMRVPDLPK